MSAKRDIEEASSTLIRQYLTMFYTVYNDKDISKIDRLKMMRRLKNNIVSSLESMEDYIIDNR